MLPVDTGPYAPAPLWRRTSFCLYTRAQHAKWTITNLIRIFHPFGKRLSRIYLLKLHMESIPPLHPSPQLLDV